MNVLLIQFAVKTVKNTVTFHTNLSYFRNITNVINLSGVHINIWKFVKNKKKTYGKFI